MLGPDHPDTIASLSALATAYQSARRLKDAIPLYERRLESRSRFRGRITRTRSPPAATSPSAYHSAGRLAAAIQLYEQTIASCQRAHGPDHPDTLTLRANLAQAYYAVGRLSDAVALLRGVAAGLRAGAARPPADEDRAREPPGHRRRLIPGVLTGCAEPDAPA